jgi:MFS family permease
VIVPQFRLVWIHRDGGSRNPSDSIRADLRLFNPGQCKRLQPLRAVLSGVIADRVDRQFLLVSIFVVRGSAFIVPVFVGGDYATLLIFAVIVGVAFYATFPPTIGLCAAHFGKENLGLVMGVLTVGHSIGAAVGAWFGGFIYDIFLRYDVMWYGAAILAFSSATFALLVSDPRSDGGPRRTTLRVLIPTSNRENLQMQQP